ncbi:MAG: hypothetical protein Q9M36_02860 [Sulfurovum sp.]|nr:hypothetical protein [Sulfurovum sp.]
MREVQTIDYLYSKERLDYPIVLEDVVVVFKRGNHAVIKQDKSQRGIMLFGCARGLEEGKRYDLRVQWIKTYHGLKEITHTQILQERGRSEVRKYYARKEDLLQGSLLPNEVLGEIIGIMRKGFLEVGEYKIPLYFKKKKLTPPNGTKIKIHQSHVGFYKRLQLVVYHKKDFEVLD